MAGENEEIDLQSFSPKNENATATSSVNLEALRKKVRIYVDMHLYQAAVFWADKVASLSNEETQDIFWLAQSLYCSGQYHRAAICIKSRNLHKTDLECRYLAAKCHFAGKEYKEALDVLEVLGVTELNISVPLNNPNENLSSEIEEQSIASAILLLKGQIYEAMDNRGLASECFRDALQHDVYCYDAFNSLVQHQMLTKEEELDLMKSLPFDSQCPDEPNVVKFLYETQLKKYDKPGDLSVPPELSCISENLDVGTALAERCYYNCDYEQCFKITTSILNKDPFHLDCLPIHISCLMELDKTNALFYLAHKLVDLYPESAVAWYAVGCYYLQISKTDAARRYLSKSTTIDRVYGPAWLMYGHSFAVENEHDQAMAAYCRASQLMKGCHLPLLYIGLEYGLSNNNKLAERFFIQTLSIAPEDPFVLHELGVVAYQNQDYKRAFSYFSDALTKVNTPGQIVITADTWESLLNNLGHVCRKLRKYEEALEYHEHALILIPQNPSTYSAIGFIHSLTGKWAEAVEYFHKALGLQRDDVFSNTMLTTVIEQLVKESAPCVETPEELPDYPFPSEVLSDSCNPTDETSDIMTEIITDDIQSISDHTHNTEISMDVEMEGAD